MWGKLAFIAGTCVVTWGLTAVAVLVTIEIADGKWEFIDY